MNYFEELEQQLIAELNKPLNEEEAACSGGGPWYQDRSVKKKAERKQRGENK